MLAVKTYPHGLAPESVFVFNLNNPLDSHTGEGRYPAMKNTPRITSDLAGIVCQLSRMAITNDLPSVFRVPGQKLLGCWVSQMASSRISSSISGQNHDVVPLAWEIFNHLDSGLRRNDVVFSNGQSGFNLTFADVI